jgi:hypothetical protein
MHQIANALWVLSSFLTMRGNSAVTRLAQGWMLAGVLALDWSALVWVRRTGLHLDALVPRIIYRAQRHGGRVERVPDLYCPLAGV